VLYVAEARDAILAKVDAMRTRPLPN